MINASAIGTTTTPKPAGMPPMPGVNTPATPLAHLGNAIPKEPSAVIEKPLIPTTAAISTPVPEHTSPQPSVGGPKFPDPSKSPFPSDSGSSGGETPPPRRSGSKISLKMIVGVMLLFLLVLGSGVGLYLSQTSQDVRHQASEAGCDGGVPIGGTACQKQGESVQQRCQPGSIPGASIWLLEYCESGQTCQGSSCQASTVPTNCESPTCTAECGSSSCSVSCTSGSPCTTGKNTFFCGGLSQSGCNDTMGNYIEPLSNNSGSVGTITQEKWCTTVQVDAWAKNNNNNQIEESAAQIIYIGNGGATCVEGSGCDPNSLKWDCTLAVPSPSPTASPTTSPSPSADPGADLGTAVSCLWKRAYTNHRGSTDATRIDTSTTLNPGDEFYYRAHIVTEEKVQVSDVVFNDILPAGITFVEDPHNSPAVKYDPATNTVGAVYPTVTNSEIVDFRVKVTNDVADKTTLTNTATVTISGVTAKSAPNPCSVDVLITEAPADPVYSCNSQCSTDAQCQTANADYVCSVAHGNTCRLQSNRDSNTCTPLTYACNAACETDAQCQGVNTNYICHDEEKVCRLASNPDVSSCTNPAGSPPAPAVGCNEACATNSDCSNSEHICYTTPDGENLCRLANYLNSTTCTDSSQAVVVQPSLPQELPQTGPTNWVNWIKAGLVTLGVGTILLLLL